MRGFRRAVKGAVRGGAQRARYRIRPFTTTVSVRVAGIVAGAGRADTQDCAYEIRAKRRLT
jgi:hypothetical protein